MDCAAACKYLPIPPVDCDCAFLKVRINFNTLSHFFMGNSHAFGISPAETRTFPITLQKN